MEKKFLSLEDCKRYLGEFFAEKNKKFWEDGILKLPEKRRKIVERNNVTSAVQSKRRKSK